jgi:hypothetical protein
VKPSFSFSFLAQIKETFTAKKNQENIGQPGSDNPKKKNNKTKEKVRS